MSGISGFRTSEGVKKYEFTNIEGQPVFSPQAFGAAADGETDDTNAFKLALSSVEKGGTVFVPDGDYLLTDTIEIPEWKMMVLSGAVSLHFTDEEKPCIKVNRYGKLNGNGSIIFVPYNYSGHALECFTDNDPVNQDELDGSPFMGATPLWRLMRTVDKIGIIKVKSSTSRQALLSDVSNIGGDGVYIGAKNVVGTSVSANSNSQWMTNVNAYVAGGFKNGFHVEVVDTDTAWMSDVFLSGMAESCETGVLIENVTGGVFCDVIIQPHPTAESNGVRVPYAKNGIKVVDSVNVDLSRSKVWDWNETNTLRTGYPPEVPYQAYALIGNCTGVIINDFGMHNSLNTNYTRIYTDNIHNLLASSITGLKGRMTPPPEYAFYKNFRQGNNIYNQDNISWRDPINMQRFDVPVLPLNAYSNPKNLYKIGYFNFGEAENPVDGFSDTLAIETITIEEVDSRGIYGYTNINFTETSVNGYWNPIGFGYGGRSPIYFYSVDGTKRYLYKLVRDPYDIQNIFNCKVSITNARRFILDYASMGSIDGLSEETYKMIPLKYADGSSLHFAGLVNVSEGKPYICTSSATFNRDGSVNKEAEVKRIACMENVPDIATARYDYVNQIPISTDSDGEIYNSTGYKKGYSLKSDGSEEVAGDSYYVTGFIPVKQGDIIRIIDPSRENFDTTLYIALYKSDKASSSGIGKLIKDINSQEYYGALTINGNTIEWDTSEIGYFYWEDFAYMRVCTHSDESIVTVNEEATKTIIGYEIKKDVVVSGDNIVLHSSTNNSKKTFRISVDDNGVLSASEITV